MYRNRFLLRSIKAKLVRKIIISLATICLLNMCSLSAQVPWPVFPGSQQANITGTVGEFRGSTSSPRFHQGFDVTNGADYRVYAIEGGTVINAGGSGCNKYIDIQHANGITRYYHIDAVVVSGNVTIGQQIGSMTTGGCAIHVHVQQMGINYLENHLAPFQDHTLPTLYTWSIRVNGHRLNQSTTRYSANSTLNGVSHRIIGNKVDLVLNADDTRLNPMGNSPGVGAVAPFQMNYQLFDAAGNRLDSVGYLDFSESPLDAHAGQVFGANSTSSNYNWILTAHPRIAPADRYWNTALQQGAIEDWSKNPALDAPINIEAEYPDGAYMIRFAARDVDFLSNQFPGSYNEETLDVPIVIDNFRPFVQKVVFEADSGQRDSSDWLWDGTALNFRSDSIEVDQASDMRIVVHCSEAMKELQLEIPAFNFIQKKTTAESGSNDQIWAFHIDSMLLANSSTCKHELKLSGLDYADHPLEAQPANLAIRQGAGTWSPLATGGVDEFHHFFYTENCLVGLEEEKMENAINIFPNPATNQVQIEMLTKDLPYHLSIWNLQGQLLFEKKNITQELYQHKLSELAAGLYLLKIESTHLLFNYPLQIVRQ